MILFLTLAVLLNTGVLIFGLWYFRKKFKKQEWVARIEREEARKAMARTEKQMVKAMVDRTLSAVKKLCLFEDLNAYLTDNHRIHIAPSRHLHLVYGPPKTGNTTLRATLWANPSIADTAMSSHYLSRETMIWREREISLVPAVAGDRAREFKNQCLTRHTLEVAGFLAGRPDPAQQKQLHVITGVREPVSAALSFLAYNHSVQRLGTSIRPTPSLDDFGHTVSAAQEIGPGHSRDPFLFQQEWLRFEFAAVFGFDPITLPFDPAKGFLIHRTERVHFLFVRVEDFERLPAILAEFYGVPANSVHVVPMNRAVERDDAHEYRQMVEAFHVPEDRLRSIYQTDFARRFYSDEERLQFMDKWRDPSPKSHA